MDQTTNLGVVEAGYAAFGRGDVEALLELFDPGIQWHSPGPDSLPWAGDYRGPQDVTRFFTALATHVDFEAFVPETFVCEGDRVVALGLARARVKRNDALIEGRWAHEFMLKDRRIVRFTAYEDTFAQAAAMTR